MLKDASEYALIVGLIRIVLISKSKMGFVFLVKKLKQDLYGTRIIGVLCKSLVAAHKMNMV
jgi:hypothetical protein